MNRIKFLREELNMTQQELANKLNGAKSTVAMYEKGDRKPSMEILLRLSDIFDCSIDYILGKSDIRNPEELKNVKFANATGLDTAGLDKEDLEELQRQIEYMKKLKKNKK